MKRITAVILSAIMLLYISFLAMAIEEGALISAFPLIKILKADFDVTSAEDWQITIKNLNGEISIKTENGLVFVNNSAAAFAMCKEKSSWYITADIENHKFNIVMDGHSIFSGECGFKPGNTEFKSINADVFVRSFCEGEENTNAVISSDFVKIGDTVITSLPHKITASELVSLIDISSNASATIFTSNGLLRTGEVKYGDYMIVTDVSGNTVRKYTFPEIDISFLKSDFYDINAENMTVTNIPLGLTEEELTGSLRANTEFTAELTADGKLKVNMRDNVYKFILQDTPPAESLIFADNGENDGFLNWYVKNGDIGAEYTDKGKSIVMKPNGSSNASFKRYIKSVSEPFVFSNNVKYIYPDNHTRHFQAPFLESSCGKMIEIRERRGEVVYNNVTNETSLDVLSGYKSKSGEWCNMQLLVKPDKSEYSFYIDGEKRADAAMYKDITDVCAVNYNLYSPDTSEEGKMYCDDIFVYKPYVRLGAVEYSDGNVSDFDSSKFESIETVKLIFANADWNKINPDSITESVTVFNGETKIPFTSKTENNKVLLEFEENLGIGEYTIEINNPKTVYNENTDIKRKYTFTVGNASGIKYAEVQTDGCKAYADTEFYNPAPIGKLLILAVYDNDGKLCGVSEKTIEKNSEYISCESGKTAAFAKAYIWNGFDKMQTIGNVYKKDF